MRIGDIYVWETDKAVGYDSRKKFQVFICAGDWRDGHTFLFINKSDYGGDFPIRNSTYSFLSLEISYVLCGSVVCYGEDELAACSPKIVGRLTQSDMKSLYASILQSDTMPRWQIQRVCGALKIAL